MMETRLTREEAERLFENGDGRGASLFTAKVVLAAYKEEFFIVETFPANPPILLGFPLWRPLSGHFVLRTEHNSPRYQELLAHAHGQAVAA